MIVPYQKTPQAVLDCLEKLRDSLFEGPQHQLEQYAASWQDSFQAKRTAFDGPTPNLTEALKKHKTLFESTAEAIRDADDGGLFR